MILTDSVKHDYKSVSWLENKNHFKDKGLSGNALYILTYIAINTFRRANIKQGQKETGLNLPTFLLRFCPAYSFSGLNQRTIVDSLLSTLNSPETTQSARNIILACRALGKRLCVHEQADETEKQETAFPEEIKVVYKRIMWWRLEDLQFVDTEKLKRFLSSWTDQQLVSAFACLNPQIARRLNPDSKSRPSMSGNTPESDISSLLLAEDLLAELILQAESGGLTPMLENYFNLPKSNLWRKHLEKAGHSSQKKGEQPAEVLCPMCEDSCQECPFWGRTDFLGKAALNECGLITLLKIMTSLKCDYSLDTSIRQELLLQLLGLPGLFAQCACRQMSLNLAVDLLSELLMQIDFDSNQSQNTDHDFLIALEVFFRDQMPGSLNERQRRKIVLIISDYLSLFPANFRKKILSKTAKRCPRKLRGYLHKVITFEDIIHLSDKVTRQWLKGIDQESLVVLMKHNKDFYDKVVRNMTARTVTMLDKNIASLGRIGYWEIEEAKANILNAVRITV